MTSNPKLTLLLGCSRRFYDETQSALEAKEDIVLGNYADKD